MISEILGVIGDVVGMIGSNNASADYSAKLREAAEKQRVSRSAKEAERILAENATRGLAGYETMKTDINSQTPTTLNAAKDWLTSGGVVDFLAQSQAATNKQLRELDSLNEAKRFDNEKLLAGYLGGPMAEYENQALVDKTQLQLGADASDYGAAGKRNDYINSIFGQLGVLGDTDWSKIVALLSKGENTLDFTTGEDFGIEAGPTSSRI